MIVLGVVLLIIGFVVGIPILWTIGVILALVGVALWVLGSMGHQVGRRRHYY
jgi:fatty-acid desaturase